MPKELNEAANATISLPLFAVRATPNALAANALLTSRSRSLQHRVASRLRVINTAKELSLYTMNVLITHVRIYDIFSLFIRLVQSRASALPVYPAHIYTIDAQNTRT